MGNHRIILILIHSMLLFQLMVVGSPLKLSMSPQWLDIKNFSSVYNFPTSESTPPASTPKATTPPATTPKTSSDSPASSENHGRQCLQCVGGNFADHRWLITSPGRFQMEWKEWDTCADSSKQMVECSGPCVLATLEEMKGNDSKLEGFLYECSDVFKSPSAIPNNPRLKASKPSDRQKRAKDQFEHRLNYTFTWSHPGVTEVDARLAELMKPWGFSVAWWLLIALVGLVCILVAVTSYKCLARRHNFQPQDALTRAFRPIQRRFQVPFFRRDHINEETMSLVRLVDREILEDQMSTNTGLTALEEEDNMEETELGGCEQDSNEGQDEFQGQKQKESKHVGGHLDTAGHRGTTMDSKSTIGKDEAVKENNIKTGKTTQKNGIDNVAFDRSESDAEMLEEEENAAIGMGFGDIELQRLI